MSTITHRTDGDELYRAFIEYIVTMICIYMFFTSEYMEKQIHDSCSVPIWLLVIVGIGMAVGTAIWGRRMYTRTKQELEKVTI